MWYFYILLIIARLKFQLIKCQQSFCAFGRVIQEWDIDKEVTKCLLLKSKPFTMYHTSKRNNPILIVREVDWLLTYNIFVMIVLFYQAKSHWFNYYSQLSLICFYTHTQCHLLVLNQNYYNVINQSSHSYIGIGNMDW